MFPIKTNYYPISQYDIGNFSFRLFDCSAGFDHIELKQTNGYREAKANIYTHVYYYHWRSLSKSTHFQRTLYNWKTSNSHFYLNIKICVVESNFFAIEDSGLISRWFIAVFFSFRQNGEIFRYRLGKFGTGVIVVFFYLFHSTFVKVAEKWHVLRSQPHCLHTQFVFVCFRVFFFACLSSSAFLSCKLDSLNICRIFNAFV